MRVSNRKGCALCDATWGDHREEIDGQVFRFCCETCAAAFRNMLDEIRKVRHWNEIEEVEIRGNNVTGRNCVARHGADSFSFYIKFNDDGSIMDFHELKG